ncbi:MAG: glycoside hydrolase family 76 protein [Chloroflexota bacterium]
MHATVRILAPLAIVAAAMGWLVAAPLIGPQARVMPAAAGAQPAIPDRNAERARATQAVIQQQFGADNSRFLEVAPSEVGAYATLWPLTQTVTGLLATSRLAGGDPAPDTVLAFDPYWDAAAGPPGYSASMQPPFGSGDRKFFDDNAWTGLALVQAYRISGDPAALARARQVFNFAVSGWDADPTHPAPGGVWWSQQMPNPRFVHRNTVSTASSAELGLQLYEAGDRSEPYYLEWATRMYTWVNTYLRGTNGLYGDHVDLAGVVDPGQLTYNQGTMIGASVLLYRIGHEPALLETARTLSDTSLEVFGPDFSQPPAYNAVFFRNLLLLGAETGDERYRAAMQAYADHVWTTLRDPSTGLFNFVYGRNRTTEPHRLLDQSAMLQIYAALALGPEAAAALT